MSEKPIIGVTVDYSTKDTYSKFPWYALRENYSSSLVSFGADVIILPCELSSIHRYAGLVDGLLISGGDFDIDPKYYNEPIHNEVKNVVDLRTSFELSMFEICYKLNKPILGICGGEQLINVALGGSLIQHIPDVVGDSIIHTKTDAGYRPSHTVKLEHGSKIHKICGAEEIHVNSSHHQAVGSLGEGLVVSGMAPDGIIEVIEDISHSFCIGVQWHPEFLLTEYDKKIIKSFVEACKKKF